LAAQDSVATIHQELSSKVAIISELSEQERSAQDALRALAEQKWVLEQELSSTRKMFAECDTSSEVIASAVAHIVALLKSHAPDLDPEILHKEYQCKTDANRDALIEGAFYAAQHFVSEYDFSMANDQDSLGAKT
jgi:hypothetical protein